MTRITFRRGELNRENTRLRCCRDGKPIKVVARDLELAPEESLYLAFACLRARVALGPVEVVRDEQ